MGIWIGNFELENDSNHSTIAALDKAIEICAKRNELSSVHEKICKMGKAEISARVDPSRYIIPSRWCDKAEVKICGNVQHNYIEQYLQAGDLDYHDRQALFEECENMRDDREAYYSCLEKF